MELNYTDPANTYLFNLNNRKDNNNDVSDVILMLLLLPLNNFTSSSSASIADSEQVNTRWYPILEQIFAPSLLSSLKMIE